MIIGFFPFEAHYDAFPPRKTQKNFSLQTCSYYKDFLSDKGSMNASKHKDLTPHWELPLPSWTASSFISTFSGVKKTKTLDAAFPGIIPGSILKVLCNLDKAISCVSDTVLQ